jgi:hypothetical protein
MELTSDDITGAGRIKPLGARHFAEKAEIVQNLTNLYNSAVGKDPMVLMHFSSIKTARMIEDLLDLQDYELVMDFVRIPEQIQAQKLQAAGQEQVQMNIATPAGMAHGDHDQGPPQPMPSPEQVSNAA